MTSPSVPASPPIGTGWQLRYWAIFMGQALSMIGSALTQFVLIWWITDTTGSVAALATAGMVALLPQALLGPLGGTVADAYSRRMLMIGPDLISAMCMIVLFLTESVQLWHVYVMMFIRSAMQAFQGPAAAASTAMLVPTSFLARAAGLNQTMIGIMTVAAAPLGALAISFMPMGWALGLDVFTATLGIVPLLIFTIPQHRIPKSERLGMWREFQAGVAEVQRSPVLLRLYALMAVMVLVLMPGMALVPLLIKSHFGGGAEHVAQLEGLGGLAMIAGGVLVAAIAPKRQVLWVLVGFSLSCFAMALVAMMPSDMFWLAIVWWVVSCVTYIMGNAPLMSFIQSTVPNQLQGRVLSLLTTVMALAAPVGLFFAAPLGEWLGVRWLFVLTGCAGGIVGLMGLMSSVLRKV